MGLPLRHNTVFGRKLNTSIAPDDWTTPNWNYGGVQKGVLIGANTDLAVNFDDADLAEELEETKWLRIGAESDSYSDYNFLNSSETKFTMLMHFGYPVTNYHTSLTVASMGTRQILFDHTDNLDDTSAPTDGFAIYAKPYDTGDTTSSYGIYVNFMGTEVRAGETLQLTSGGGYVLIVSYDSSLGADNISIKLVRSALLSIAYLFSQVTGNTSGSNVVSVTKNPTMGRAKQRVTYTDNTITGIENDGAFSIITFSAQHNCLRRGTQLTIESGTSGFNGTHEIHSIGLGMKTCKIPTPGADPATETGLTGVWKYYTYDPITSNPTYGGCRIYDLAFWDNTTLSAGQKTSVMQSMQSFNGSGPHWNTYNVNGLSSSNLYSWHPLGDGLEDGAFDVNNNQIYNMSAVGGWQRNIVDRDINTDFEENSLYDAGIVDYWDGQ